MLNKKISNKKQIISHYQIQFNGGTEDGKKGILVNNGRLEVLFNISNALDISFVKYKGYNISFLSKNGINDNKMNFENNFEGGFLYTCGLDNVSSCVSGKPIHGSLHYKKAENVNVFEKDDCVIVSGEINNTALFGEVLTIKREYTISSNSILVNDTIINNGTKDTEFVVLYHTNYGYPFLDECLKMEIPADKTIPQTEIATKRESEKFKITCPIDNNLEDVYYHYLKNGDIILINNDLGIKVNMKYSTVDFPVTLEWKSMASHDYALGIEPAVTRFDEFKPVKLKVNENKNYKIQILFE